MDILGYTFPPDIADLPPPMTTTVDGLEAVNVAAAYNLVRSADTLEGLVWAYVFYSVWTSSIKDSDSEMHAFTMATNSAARLLRILECPKGIYDTPFPAIPELQKIDLYTDIDGSHYAIYDIYHKGRTDSDESGRIFAAVLYYVWESLPRHGPSARAILSAKAALAATDGELPLIYEGSVVSDAL